MAPKPIKPDADTEREYAAQLRSLVRLMAKELYAEITPALKALKPQYAADAAVSMDSWVDDILAAIRRVSSRFTSSLFEAQAQRIARRAVSRADAKNAEEFQKSINATVGVNMSAILRPTAISDYVQASIAENVSLIKSVPQTYFQRVETVVLEGMKSGLAPTSIAKQIQEETGVNYRRAKFIARDQMAKINSDLTRKRQMDAGIEFYRSADADDVRVSGNPAGIYPNAKIKCWRISRQDIGYGPGVYTVKDGASYAGVENLHPGKHHPNCRCVAISLIPGINYDPPKK